MMFSIMETMLSLNVILETTNCLFLITSARIPLPAKNHSSTTIKITTNITLKTIHSSHPRNPASIRYRDNSYPHNHSSINRKPIIPSIPTNPQNQTPLLSLLEPPLSIPHKQLPKKKPPSYHTYHSFPYSSTHLTNQPTPQKKPQTHFSFLRI